MNIEKGVRSWPVEGVRKYLRTHGKAIYQAAKRGDDLAIRLVKAYQTAYSTGSIEGSRESLSLRDALDDYVRRDLDNKEREHLAGAIGHRIDEESDSGLILPRFMH